MQVSFEEYSFSKLDAITQFHIVRRVAPVIGEVLAVLSNAAIKTGEGSVKFSDIDFDKLAKDLNPVLTALSKLPDDDVNYVLYALLKSVQRKSGGGFARVLTDQNHFMFDDIKNNLPMMFQLAAKAFQTNLQGFLTALPSGLKEGALQSQPIG